MALLTISGFPCSGKTRIANQLRDDFEQRLGESSYAGPKLRVVVVDDESSHVPRSTYDDSRKEKNGRANLYSAVTRNLGADTIVICDSANYIKGFRYQMYCAAREAHARVCTIHVATPPAQCAEHHAARPPDQQYAPETFDNLIMRFEEPSSMVRWDSPLFVIAHSDTPPFSSIWETITTGAKAPPTQSVIKSLAPPPNALHILSTTTSKIVSALLAHTGSMPGSGSFVVPSPPAPAPALTASGRGKAKGKGDEEGEGQLLLRLPTKTITLAEMQRLKRQFENVQIKGQTNGTKVDIKWSEGEVAVKFVKFLEATWGTGV